MDPYCHTEREFYQYQQYRCSDNIAKCKLTEGDEKLQWTLAPYGAGILQTQSKQYSGPLPHTGREFYRYNQYRCSGTIKPCKLNEGTR